MLLEGGVVRLAQEATERGDTLLLLDEVEYALLGLRQAEACAQQRDAGVRGRGAVRRGKGDEQAVGKRDEARDQVFAHARAGELRQQGLFRWVLQRAIGVEEGVGGQEFVPGLARLGAAVPVRPELRKFLRVDEREAQGPELAQEAVIMQPPVQMRATRHHLQGVARRSECNGADARKIRAPRPARHRFRLLLRCSHLPPPRCHCRM